MVSSRFEWDEKKSKEKTVKHGVSLEEAKVTIVLSRDSVDFFKCEAEKHGGTYQRMM